MHMGTAAGALEHPGNKDFTVAEDSAADRAEPFYVTIQAVYAAAYVHQAVFAPGNRWKGQGFYQLAPIEPR
jgi:hypothetical protein